MAVVVGILSVTLKSRPFTKCFAKAESNRRKQKNTVRHAGSGNTQEVSSDMRSGKLLS